MVRSRESCRDIIYAAIKSLVAVNLAQVTKPQQRLKVVVG